MAFFNRSKQNQDGRQKGSHFTEKTLILYIEPRMSSDTTF